MADEANENLDSSNQATEEVVNTEEVEDTSAQEASEDLEALKEKNKKLFERAKKAEDLAKKLKAEKPAETKPKEDSFSITLKDQIALQRANIHEDDIEDVVDYAKFKGISLSEALKSPVVKATLKDKTESRQTAEATNTGGSKRISAKLTDEQLIEKAASGREFDPEALAEARMNQKKAQFKR